MRNSIPFAGHDRTLSLDFLPAANGANDPRCVSIGTNESDIHDAAAGGFVRVQGNRNLPPEIIFVAALGLAASLELLGVVL